ncbi:MAG: phosphoribosyltransferase [Burkholderiaceae bacterium]
MSDRLEVSWDDYHQLIEALALQVHESAWKPDVIVCMARGGLRVGDVFSRLFRLPLGVLFSSSYRERGGQERGALQIGSEIASVSQLPAGRWLLVDDLADSGGTLEGVLPWLSDRYPQIAQLRTAVLWTKDGSRFRPDYSVARVPASCWIAQPFERYDALSIEALSSSSAPTSDRQVQPAQRP